ncbi:diuretic hormone class 2-like [Microplitis mediator]|uniref:diuretic hormone class 2-like n=1 Tax=Microplitis mediator TaxID=375433 RepID=UPI002556EF58|nr:diuretic hormone class 2-like [Microplitis mediator]XP_057333868.1 diuretic hormone class 2-like [Microplitis mediator]
MQKQLTLALLVIAAVTILTVIDSIDAAPFPPERQLYLEQLEDDPQAFYELIAQYYKLKELENKRAYGLDFGLSRGFSGSQTAKHLMGMAAANYAGGPGRRRRSEQA